MDKQLGVKKTEFRKKRRKYYLTIGSNRCHNLKREIMNFRKTETTELYVKIPAFRKQFLLPYIS